MTQPKKITIDDTEYIRADYVDQTAKAKELDGLEYVIVRTYSAGVFAGYLKDRQGKEGTILNARRLWYWSGAASLSQASQEGFSNPDKCKFPAEVPQVILTEIIEILQCSEKARKSIAEVQVWAS